MGDAKQLYWEGNVAAIQDPFFTVQYSMAAHSVKKGGFSNKIFVVSQI